MLRKCLLLVIILISLLGCTPETSNLPTLSPTKSRSEPSPPPTTIMPAGEVNSGITIVGTVKDVSLSADVIIMEKPVEGLDVIALSEESVLVSAEGEEITLRDIQAGMQIQAAGQPGGSNALLASQVLVLNAAPTNAADVPSRNLATPAAQQPAAGICGHMEGELAVVTIYPDIPDPRCQIVSVDQKLKVVNRRLETLEVSLASLEAVIEPGGERTFQVPFGEILAPGVHYLQVLPCCSAALWLQEGQ
jgi:hypothetical protein